MDKTPVKIEMLGLYSAKPGCGKDTFAKLLKQEYPEVEVIHFADALTDEVAKLFPEVIDFYEIRNEPKLKDWKFNMFALKNVHPDFDKYVAFCVSVLGLDMDEPRSVRDHLLWYGTSYIRQHLGYDDKWLTEGLLRARNLYVQGKVPVIADVRFENELAAVQRIGGKVLEVHSTWNARELDSTTSIAEGRLDTLAMDGIVFNTHGAPEGMLRQFKQDWTI
jgi:hypothetical protein